MYPLSFFIVTWSCIAMVMWWRFVWQVITLSETGDCVALPEARDCVTWSQTELPYNSQWS